MQDYQAFYEKISGFVMRMPHGVVLLNAFNRFIVIFFVAIYPVAFIYLFFVDRIRFWLSLSIIGGSFVLVSLLRKLIDSPRPYENWDITPLIAKDKKGQSFPSRHVFSAALISCFIWQLHRGLGAFCFALAILLALCRVLSGVHYPKDVLAGYLIGCLAGALYLII